VSELGTESEPDELLEEPVVPLVEEVPEVACAFSVAALDVICDRTALAAVSRIFISWCLLSFRN
jgi:hypothetical protein